VNTLRHMLRLGGALLLLAWVSAQASDPATNALQNMPDRGSVAWQGWRFDYHIEDTNMEGLTISNLQYKNHRVLAKASLPVVRVKYKGNAQHIGSGCGPFPDRFFAFNIAGLFTPALSTGTIRPYPGKPGLSRVVRFLARDASGVETLGVYVYAEIGGYLLWHGWNFRSDATLEPILYSSGWSCRDGVKKNDHRHHPYWRIVFDIDNNANEFWELRAVGQAPATAKQVSLETDIVRKSGEDLALVASSKLSSRHAIVRFRTEPNAEVDPAGAPWFAFSRIDAAIRKYKADEDRGWAFDAKSELPYREPESTGGGRAVLWAVTHLGHPYIPGKDDENSVGWHWTGPVIQLVNWD
jgi:hypothetical protein